MRNMCNVIGLHVVVCIVRMLEFVCMLSCDKSHGTHTWRQNILGNGRINGGAPGSRAEFSAVAEHHIVS